MLQFVRAQIHNFVVLMDVSIDFSTLESSSVTVIRAENGSGKTTCLRALQWALYGDRALPTPDWPLQPVDWTPEQGTIDVSVSIDFVHVEEAVVDGAEPRRHHYRLTRRAKVSPDGDTGRRRTSPPTLLRRDSGNGYVEVPEPETTINQLLPYDLREFFLFNGDDAMNYVEASDAASQQHKRSRVKHAIRALLGVGVVEGTQARVNDRTLRDLRQRLAKASGDKALERLETTFEDAKDELDRLEKELEEQDERLAQLESRRPDLIRIRDQQLERGNYERLKAELTRAESDHSKTSQKLDELVGSAADTLHSPSLHAALLQGAVANARALLQPMMDSGRIPATHVQLLRERLDKGVCICGEDLSDGDPRDTVETLLRESLDESVAADRLGQLYYACGELLSGQEDPLGHWPTVYAGLMRDEAQERRDAEEIGARKQRLKEQVANIDEDALRLATLNLEQNQAQATEIAARAATLNAEISAQNREVDDLRKKVAAAMKSVDKQTGTASALRVASDVDTVLTKTLQNLREIKLQAVSDHMNSLFVEMIAADPDHDPIKRVLVDESYDIHAFGPTGNVMDPMHQLNGASRRALTMAFMLALGRVAGAKAPNIIDTPLGMTSQEVRRSLFRVSARESSQLVLFLTRDETSSIQDLLDDQVGAWQTLTNQGHYPQRIVRQTSKRPEALRCDCNHRQYCDVCERVSDHTSSDLTKVQH